MPKEARKHSATRPRKDKLDLIPIYFGSRIVRIKIVSVPSELNICSLVAVLFVTAPLLLITIHTSGDGRRRKKRQMEKVISNKKKKT